MALNPPKDLVFLKPENYQHMIDFIRLRHQMFESRFVHKKPYPWSDDKTLNTGKFTNVFRDLDRGTVWFWEEILSREASFESALFHSVLYRQLNRMSTMQWLIHECGLPTLGWTAPQFRKLAKALQTWKHEMGNPVFTGAYMLAPGPTQSAGDRLQLYVDRLQQIRNMIVAPKKFGLLNVAEASIHNRVPSIEEIWSDILEFPGIGGFLGYEVVTDLTYTPFASKAIDYVEDSWAFPGPGANRGLSYLFAPLKRPGTLEVRVADKHPATIMRWIMSDLNARKLLPKDLYLDIRSIEHCLCELQKYARGIRGGKLKNNFNVPADEMGQTSLEEATEERYPEKPAVDFIAARKRLVKRLQQKAKGLGRAA